jgi:hypothetical protein
VSLYTTEGGAKLRFIHRHAVAVQFGTVYQNVLDSPSSSTSQRDQALADTWGQQGTYDRG